MTAKQVKNLEDGAMTYGEERPDWIDKNSDRGSENITREDIALPRVDVLQALSPQINKKDGAYIEGAEQGTIFNILTGELYGESIHFIPVYFVKQWLLWKIRKAGGGLLGVFPNSHEVEKAQRNLPDEVPVNQTEVMDTAVHYGMIVKAGGELEEAVISMSRSKMKVSRKLNSMVRLAGGDRFSRVYKISSVEDKNAAGEAYWNLAVQQLGYAPESMYRAAETMYESIKAGERSVDYTDPDANEVDDQDLDDM